MNNIQPIKQPNQIKNTSGHHPLQFWCLVKLEQAEEVTTGGIVLVRDTVEQEQAAKTRAYLIEAGSAAFTDVNRATGQPIWPNPPQPGDELCITKYTVDKITGIDGEKYWLINDRDILGVITR